MIFKFPRILYIITTVFLLTLDAYTVFIRVNLSEAYLKPFHTSMMKLFFTKIAFDRTLTFLQERSIDLYTKCNSIFKCSIVNILKNS